MKRFELKQHKNKENNKTVKNEDKETIIHVERNWKHEQNKNAKTRTKEKLTSKKKKQKKEYATTRRRLQGSRHTKRIERKRLAMKTNK